MQVYKSPSKMKFKLVNKPRPEPKKIKDLKRGDTFMFRDSPYMKVDVSLYQAIKDSPHFNEIDTSLNNALAVVNLATGRVFIPSDDELEQEAVLINITGDVEYI